VRQQYIHPQRRVVIDQHKTGTIGYFGDSFCADSINQGSYCNLLAKRLAVGTITHWGVGGTSIWYMFDRFMELHNENQLPDNIVIVYTDPDRLYHPDVLLPAWALDEESENDLEKACDLYMKHLDFPNMNFFKYKAGIEWFDQNIISKIVNRHNVVQLFAFQTYGVEIKNSPVLDYTLMPMYSENMANKVASEDLFNHLTKEQNLRVAEDLERLITKGS